MREWEVRTGDSEHKESCEVQPLRGAEKWEESRKDVSSSFLFSLLFFFSFLFFGSSFIDIHVSGVQLSDLPSLYYVRHKCPEAFPWWWLGADEKQFHHQTVELALLVFRSTFHGQSSLPCLAQTRPSALRPWLKLPLSTPEYLHIWFMGGIFYLFLFLF